LIEYIERWAENFKCSDMPEVKNIFSSTEEIQYAKAESLTMEVYKKKMSSKIFPHADEFLNEREYLQLHQESFEQSEIVFRRNFGFPSYSTRKRDIAKKIDDTKNSYIALNSANKREKLEKENQAQIIKLMQDSKTQADEMEKLRKQLEAAKENLQKAQQDTNMARAEVDRAAAPSWWSSLAQQLPSLIPAVGAVAAGVTGVLLR